MKRSGHQGFFNAKRAFENRKDADLVESTNVLLGLDLSARMKNWIFVNPDQNSDLREWMEAE